MMFNRRSSNKPPLIGPFFIIALIIGGVLFFYSRSFTNRRLASMPPPLLERQRAQGAGPEAVVVPDPAFVCDHAAVLKLDQGQTARIQQIVAPYLEKKAALERHLQPATKRFEEFQAKAQKARHTQLQELQEHMAEISQLSGEMAALREQYWLRVREVLTPEQRRQAEDLWRRELERGKKDRV